MRLRRTVPPRSGATMVESALVLGVFLILVFGLLDLGICVFRYHLVAGAARGCASSDCEWRPGAAPWGPQTTGACPGSTPLRVSRRSGPFSWAWI